MYENCCVFVGKPLLSFFLALGVVFFAFAQMAFIVYARLLYSFSTFLRSAETLFTLMLSKYSKHIVRVIDHVTK